MLGAAPAAAQPDIVQGQCSSSASPASYIMQPAGGSASFAIDYDRTMPPLDGICFGPYCEASECANAVLDPPATTAATWLTLSRSGGTVTFTAGANPSTSDRSATVQFGLGSTFSLTQEGAVCDTGRPTGGSGRAFHPL